VSARTFAIALIGAALGVLAGCFCPGSGDPVPSGSFVWDGTAGPALDGNPTAYEIAIDEAGEEVVEVYRDDLGMHRARYRVVGRSTGYDIYPPPAYE
jgi:hypothetical protein